MRFRRTERAMAVGLASKILEKRFKLNVVTPNVPLTRTTVGISKETFGKVPIEPSLDLSGIATTKATADY